MGNSKSVFLRTKGCASNLPLREAAYHMLGILPVPLLLLVIVWSHPRWPTALIGAVLVAIGEAIRFWVAGYLGGEPVDGRKGQPLAVDGPYRLVRHPRYWGNLFIGLGLSLIADWWIGYAVFIFYCILAVYVLIPVEEEMLEKEYGEEYRVYMAEKNRFLPRWRGRRVPVQRYSFRDALKGERFMLIFLFSIGICFAIKWLFLVKQV